LKVNVSLREALEDERLLGGAIPGESWVIWRALLLATMGEALKPEERELFSLVTGRSHEPLERVDEFWSIAGRRSGKTRSAAVLGSYLATCIDWSDVLAPGERAALPVLASSTNQAARAFEHITGVLQHSPELSEMLEGEPTADCIRLATRVDISIKPANFRTIRGVTAIAVIGDELAFWHIEGSRNPDKEILNAARPAMATTGGPLIVISSPYARRGELYATFRSDYGPEGDPSILVAKGASKTFNPTLPQRTIDRAYLKDPASAVAEYGGEFRTDVEALLTREIVEDAIDSGVTERAPQAGIRYYGFVDPSGGSSDSMTLAIAHKEGDRAVLDLVRERKAPYSPDVVTEEFCAIIKPYGITSVIGDNFGGEWCKEPFRKRGIPYDLSKANKSQLYLALVPALNSGLVGLLDIEEATNQLVGLERRTGTSGRDIVDHPKGAAFHDDVANAIAGAIFQLLDSPKMAAGGLFELMRREAEARENEHPTKPALPEYAPGSVEYARGLREALPQEVTP
jgi:hypothetical protein